MINGDTTTTLKNAINCFPNDKDNIINILDNTLQRYQWHYQAATGGKAYRDVRDSNIKHIEKTIQLLKNIGQYVLAKDVGEALYNKDDISKFTKDKVLSQAKKYMSEQFVNTGMKQSTYNKDFAYTMEFLFKEWCEEFILSNAPEHYDYDFDPYAS